ncbi:hypothetical protein THAOC_07283, partial [Thalassiosira oceanica]
MVPGATGAANDTDGVWDSGGEQEFPGTLVAVQEHGL